MTGPIDRRSVRVRLADWMRKWADRLDYQGAPKRTHLSFTFENRQGIKVRQDAKGCPLWYYGKADYERAHVEADRPC